MRNRSSSRLSRFAGAALLLVPLTGSIACGRSDADIEAEVQARLAGDPVTAPLKLQATVTEGIATITGEVATVEEQARALDVARAVAGVSEVVDATDLDEDERLALAVRSALASDASLAGVPIDVEAKDGFVRLLSDATNREQRERAVAVAQAVGGVRMVEDRMR